MVHLLTAVCGVVSALLCALLVSLWRTIRQYDRTVRPRLASCTGDAAAGHTKVCVVLGSGGHTSEMLGILSAMPHSAWHKVRPIYLVGFTDSHSAQCAERFEQSHEQHEQQQQQHKVPTRHTDLSTSPSQQDGRFCPCAARHCIRRLPRPREVGQSYLTSVYTTLCTLCAALRMMYDEAPDVLLLNGPGMCVPVVWACYALSVCLPWRCKSAQSAGRSRPCVVYIESFTCVHHLSLTARLLVPWLADVTIVSWPALYRAAMTLHPRGQLHGVYGCSTLCECRKAADVAVQRKESSSMCHLSTLRCSHGIDAGSHNCTMDDDIGVDAATAGSRDTSGMKDSWDSRSDCAACAKERLVDAGVDDSACARECYAVVTVGSTRFDALVRAMTVPAMCALLHRRFGIRHLYVQYGTMPYTLACMAAATSSSLSSSLSPGTGSLDSSDRHDCSNTRDNRDDATCPCAPMSTRSCTRRTPQTPPSGHPKQEKDDGRDRAACISDASLSSSSSTAPSEQTCNCGDVTVTAFAYRPDLSSLLQRAALVVTHAGAGTILECLKARRRLVVVPNRALMSDHQLQLAHALADGRYLFCVAVEDVMSAMVSLDFADRRVYPVEQLAARIARTLLPWLGEQS